MNMDYLLAKRASEIIQEKEQAINYLNINAAINQASREFEKEVERRWKLRKKY